jgi:HAD superfamily hydrolase (TIGR01509 family)
MLYFSAMITPIRALLFDFDGLILDTETPEVNVWKSIYAEHGFRYPADLWAQNIGMWPHDSGFDPARHLRELTQDSPDEEALRARHRKESDVLIEGEPVGEGVSEYLAAARQRGLKLGIVSSSWRQWVEGHLARLGLLSRFDCIVTSDFVARGRTKPNPDLYMKALEVLGLRANEAIAFEDSPHGLKAARAAGIFAVGVPNPATAQLDLSQANVVVKSLAAVPLEELLRRVVA